MAARKGAAPLAPQPQAAAPAGASTSVVVSAEQLGQVRGTWIEAKRAELGRAQQALGALKAAGLKGTTAGAARLARLRERIGLLKRVVRALEAGYVPLPRFDGHTLRLDVQELPADALVALVTAQRAKLFHEVRLVTGQPAGAGSRPRRTQRDPLLVGVIRTPGHWTERAYWPGQEEHFLVAWWRPEDEREETLF